MYSVGRSADSGVIRFRKRSEEEEDSDQKGLKKGDIISFYGDGSVTFVRFETNNPGFSEYDPKKASKQTVFLRLGSGQGSGYGPWEIIKLARKYEEAHALALLIAKPFGLNPSRVNLFHEVDSFILVTP